MADGQNITDNINKYAHSMAGMFENWYLDYASYTLLDRAIPHLGDGLKPVQRRILHTMFLLEDGRYNKVANIIGQTMQFHPHGDSSIGDALVNLGQKDLLIDTQGNWGNIFTGDRSAAPRYIEARLSKFALDVVFNPKTTEWKMSYDGRKKEPITLPIKFPLLLAQGTEGIGVGFASKIFPHNFNELLDASIAYLKGEQFELYPDFPTGGLIDVNKYNNGERGGFVRVRAKIEKTDNKTLTITEIPFGKTSESLIKSIITANDKGKIKIKKIDDNTADKASIVITLPSGVSPDKTIDALYACTECDIRLTNNSCVIDNQHPRLMGVDEMLKISTDHTVDLLRMELNIRCNELKESWHYSSLEKIFFEQKIYRELEKDTLKWEDQLQGIATAFNPFRHIFERPITMDDIIKLTEKPVRRISKFDIKRAEEHIQAIEDELAEVENHLEHLVDYAINYFRQIKKRYGSGRERKSEIRSFEAIEAVQVVANNAKLYANYKEGFIGTGLKKDEYICDCSDIDDIIVILKNGKYQIVKVSDKQFVGTDILYVAVFNKNDNRTIYNIVYRDGGPSGYSYAKRCAVTGITRNKEYDFTRGVDGSKILYLSANPNGESEVVRVQLRPLPRLKKTSFEYDFGNLEITGRGTKGRIVSKFAVKQIVLKEKGVSTLGGRKIWFDESIFRLNVDGRGKYLGEFSGDDKILVITTNGCFIHYSFDLSTHFEENILLIEKYIPSKVFSIIYWDAEQQYYYVKRFSLDTSDKLLSLIGDSPSSKLVSITEVKYPRFEISFGGKNSERENEIIEVAEFIGVKTYKAKGKRLTNFVVENIYELEPIVKQEYQEEDINENHTEAEDISPLSNHNTPQKTEPTSQMTLDF